MSGTTHEPSAPSPGPRTRRLFFAIWPDDATRERLATIGAALPARSGRRVAAGNLHITLCFLGSVEEDRLDCLRRGAEAIRVPAFTLPLERLGWFRRARVVWLAPLEAHIPPALIALAGALNRVVRGCGLEPDGRAWRPHLTLSRKAAKPPRGQAFDALYWDIREFTLVESVTRNKGPEYRVLERWPLPPA